VLEGVEQYSVHLKPGLLVSHASTLSHYYCYCYFSGLGPKPKGPIDEPRARLVGLTSPAHIPHAHAPSKSRMNEGYVCYVM